MEVIAGCGQNEAKFSLFGGEIVCGICQKHAESCQPQQKLNINSIVSLFPSIIQVTSQLDRQYDYNKSMSNFTNLKSIWETKARQSAQPQAPSKVLKPSLIAKEPSLQSSTQPAVSQSPQSITGPTPGDVETTIARQSVAQLKNSLEGKIKFGFAQIIGNPYRLSGQTESLPVKLEVSNQAATRLNNPQEATSHERIPSYMQSKMNLERVLGQKKPEPRVQTYIDLKKQSNTEEILSPEERTNYVIQRIFGTTQQQHGQRQPARQQKCQQGQTGTSYLQKEEQARNLNLRGQKKQKRSLGDFDDA